MPLVTSGVGLYRGKFGQSFLKRLLLVVQGPVNKLFAKLF